MTGQHWQQKHYDITKRPVEIACIYSIHIRFRMLLSCKIQTSNKRKNPFSRKELQTADYNLPVRVCHYNTCFAKMNCYQMALMKSNLKGTKFLNTFQWGKIQTWNLPQDLIRRPDSFRGPTGMTDKAISGFTDTVIPNFMIAR